MTLVTDTEGYNQLQQYLMENLAMFQQDSRTIVPGQNVLAFFEQQLSNQIILLCGQHDSLTFAQRNLVIREVDAIVSDLEEIMASVVHKPLSKELIPFITEYAGLIKNLFDTAILSLEAQARI